MTVAWLLERSLAERQREEEEAEEVKQLEDVLAEAEDKLLVALEEFWVSPSRPSSLLRSRLRFTGTWPWTESGRERRRAGERRGEGGPRLGMQFLFGVWVLPEAYVRGLLGDDFQIYSRIQLRLVRQWMHVWFWLVFFYGPLYLAATCSVLFLPEECGGGFFWEMTSGWMPYSDPSLVRQWKHISVSLRVGLVARGVREN